MRSFYLLTIIYFCSSFSLSAQAINDEPCNAIELIMNGPVYTADFAGASAQLGESAILPPFSRNESYFTGSCERLQSWCDLSGFQNTPNIDSSVWFKFTVPDTGEVELFFRNNNALPLQLAVYSTSDCADWESYKLLVANQFQALDLTARLALFCLTPGDQYYLLLDTWVDPYINFRSQADTVQVGMRTNTFTNPGPSIVNVQFSTDPTCPGGQNGFGKVIPITGALPLDIQWSNGDSTSHFYHASAGDYFLTITDNCGLTLIADFPIEDPLKAPSPVLDANPKHINHPINCGTAQTNGQINAVLEEHLAPPYRFRWNTGDTTAFISDLAPGDYTLSITNHCGEDTLVKHYHLGMNAGPDKTCLDQVNEGVFIGVDNSRVGGAADFFSYQNDFTPSATAPSCHSLDDGFVAQNDWWIPYDFNDFNVNPMLFGIREIEVMAQSIPNELISSGVPVRFRLLIVNTKDLTAPNLQFITLDSLETTIPLLPDFQAFRVPLTVNKGTLSTDDILLLHIEVSASMEEGHFFNLAINDQSDQAISYHTSRRCGIYQPTPIADGQVITKIVYQTDFTGIEYEWEAIDNGQESSDPVQFVRKPGTYQVTITDTNCGITVVDEVVYAPTNNPACITGVKDIDQGINFSFTPNPSDAIFQLNGGQKEGAVHLMVYNAQGQLVAEEHCNNSQVCELDLGKWPAGIYFAQVRQGPRQEIHKIVRQ